MQLETLITQLGITEHMAELSDWRDGLLRETAATLQAKDTDCAEALAGKVAAFEIERSTHTEALAAKESELASAKAAYAEKAAYQEAMVQKVSAVLASKDPAQYEALAKEFLTPAEQLARAEKLAQIAALQAELGITPEPQPEA